MERLSELKQGLEDTWHSLSDGWRHLRERTSGTLTRFTPSSKGKTPAERAQTADFPSADWALLAGDVLPVGVPSGKTRAGASLPMALRQALGVHQQRRAALDPDRGVLLRHLARAQRQDDEVQDRAPQPAGQLDHAVVVQELRQVALHRRPGGGVGRAQVHQQQGGLAGAGGLGGIAIGRGHAALSGSGEHKLSSPE